MTLYVLALNRGIKKIIPEGCSVIGCGFPTIPAWQIGQIVSIIWTSVALLEIPGGPGGSMS